MTLQLGIAALLLFLVTTGCTGAKRVPVQPADEAYTKGTLAHEDELHEQAIQHYRMFLDHYPLDARAEEVERRIADAYFEDEKFPEAIAAYSDVQRMNPTSMDQAEIEYRIGEAYRQQMDSIDRDLAAAQNAHERFRSIALRYPGTEEAAAARSQLSAAREHLAERELYVAEFYADKGSYRAAATRAGEVVVRFPDTSVTRNAVALLSELGKDEGDTTLSSLADNALDEIDRRAAVENPEERPQLVGPALSVLRLHLEHMKTVAAAPRDDVR